MTLWNKYAEQNRARSSMIDFIEILVNLIIAFNGS